MPAAGEPIKPIGWAATLSGLLARVRGKPVVYPLGYMATLDGMRGLLTIGVLLAHTSLKLFGGAMVYMDVFFTMSGFLITSILLKTYEKQGRIDLKRFYVRRFLRLYPALTEMVIVIIILSWFFAPDFKPKLIEALAAWFYLTDYWWALSSVPSLYTSHTWSLAVEEQFYVIWPLLFIGLIKISGITLRTAVLIFSLALLFWIWRGVLNYHDAPLQMLYNTLDSRADALLIGCGLAVLLKVVDLHDHPRLWKLCSMSLMPIAIAMVIVAVTLKFNWNAGWYYYVTPFFGAFPAVIAIVGLLHPEKTFMHRLYEHPVPVFIGRMCYSLYIWHFPIFVWFVFNVPHHTSRWILLIGWPIAFTVATLSYYFVELPFMRARPGA